MKEPKKLTIPVVHMNGTGRNELLKQQREAAEAIDKAMDALQAAAPHGRDYYTLSADAYLQARNEHQNRMDRLRSVFDELYQIFEAVNKQGGR